MLFVHTREDARRWIPLGFTTFQPSELAKFAVVLIFAHLISTNYDRMKDPKYGVWPFLALMGIVVLLMLLEPHLSGTILILSIGIIMMFVGGTDLKWFMIGGLLLAAAVVVIVLIPGVIPYAMSRIQHWRDPWIDPQGKGFQTIQSLYAIGSGGLMGVGIATPARSTSICPSRRTTSSSRSCARSSASSARRSSFSSSWLLIWRGYVIASCCRDGLRLDAHATASRRRWACRRF